MLTFAVWDFSSFFCATVRPPSPLPQPNEQGNYCPLPAGPFAISTSISPGNGYELVTFYTRLRALDPSKNELFCLDLDTTPLRPGPLDSPYGRARSILWATVGLAIAYWVVVGLARLVSAWGRGTRGGPGVWAKMERAGFVLASAISGERLATSPALMRFCESRFYPIQHERVCEHGIQALRLYEISSSTASSVPPWQWSPCNGQILSVGPLYWSDQ